VDRRLILGYQQESGREHLGQPRKDISFSKRAHAGTFLDTGGWLTTGTTQQTASSPLLAQMFLKSTPSRGVSLAVERQLGCV
jgi:hypothetical protein